MSLPPFLLAEPAPISPIPSQARLKALYASTSTQKLSNSTGYAANLSWWTSVLDSTLASGHLGSDRLIITVNNDLLSHFENNDGSRPKGLGGVVDSMVISGKLYPLGTFLTSPTPINDPGSLTYRLLGRPLLWGLNKINPFGSGGDTVDKEETLWKRHAGKEYVHLGLLERAAAAVIKHITDNPPLDYSDSLYTPTSFRETFGALAIPSKTSKASSTSLNEKNGSTEKLSERDVEVLVKWLSRDTGLLVSDGSVIKIIEKDAVGEEITEADRGTVTILSTIKTVEKQIESITQQINQCTVTAKAQLSKSQKTLALATLRSKKHLEEILTKRLATSHQLQTVLSGINTAQNDIEIVNAYSTATSTLKGILANPQLDLDRVEKTTQELADVLASQEEVDQAIRVGGRVAVGAAGVEVDEDELERELEGLVLEEKERLAEEDKDKEKDKEQKDKQRVERESKIAEQGKQRPMGSISQTGLVIGQARESTELGSKISTGAGENDWERKFEEAQQRQVDEGLRAEQERLKRDERRVAAE